MGLIPKVYYFYKLTNDSFVKKFLLIPVFFLVIISTAFGPAANYQSVDTGAKIKAVYIYNFTKYIEWPSDYQSGEFIIGILGDNDALFKELDNMSKVKKVASRSFSIKKITSTSDLDKPHIIYIPKNSKVTLATAALQVKNKSTLLVTEEPGLAKRGAAINFIIVGNRQKFELNKTNVESHNLKVAPTLEKLAILVNN